MKSLFLITFLLSFVCLSSFAQNAGCIILRDEVVSKTPELIERNSEKLNELIKAWDMDCFANEELFRLKTIFQIAQNSFDEDSYNQNAIGFLKSFESGQTESNSFYHAPNFRKENEETKRFDESLRMYAERLILLKKAFSQLEIAILKHYAHQENIWVRLERDELSDFKIQKFYKDFSQAKNKVHTNNTFGFGTIGQLGSNRERLGFALHYQHIAKDWFFKVSQGVVSGNMTDFQISDQLTNVNDDSGYLINIEGGGKILGKSNFDVFGGLLLESQFYKVRVSEIQEFTEQEIVTSQIKNPLFLGPALNFIYYNNTGNFIGLRTSYLVAQQTSNDLQNNHFSASLYLSFRLKRSNL